MKKLTPVIPVDAIEPCLPFWEQLGFSRVAEVPMGDRLGFVILSSGNVEIMYQSMESIAGDVPAMARLVSAGTPLYIEVEQLDELLPKLHDAKVIVPERTTFYGAREIFVQAPCGTVVGFAEQEKRTED